VTFEAPPLAKTVAALPAFVPFVGPLAIERRLGRQFDLRLGANESAWGVSPKARAAMERSLRDCAWYGDPENYELREALAFRHRVSPANILVASGIDDVLGLIVRGFVDPGDAVVTSQGTYPTFVYHAQGYGAVVHRVPYDGDRVDLSRLAETACRQHARIVYLANPDNPSGTWRSATELLEFAEALPRRAVLLLDEAYSDFAPPEALPAIDVGQPRVVRCRTFSKAHGLAGLRIGYAVAHSETVAALDRIRLHFGVNRVAQAGALASLGDERFVSAVIADVARGVEHYGRLAHRVGLRPVPSATNFVAMDVGDREAASRLTAALLERGVFVRRATEPPMDQWIRVTVGLPEQRAAFESVICGLLSEAGEGEAAWSTSAPTGKAQR
jgi:histidinol-phosphate aminotransferase